MWHLGLMSGMAHRFVNILGSIPLSIIKKNKEEATTETCELSTFPAGCSGSAELIKAILQLQYACAQVTLLTDWLRQIE